MTNKAQQSSLFDAVELAPQDPILGITEAYNADTNPDKVNLGVGVYYDDDGKVPLLKCVLEAGRRMAAEASPHTYLPIDGLRLYDDAVKNLVFGKDNKVISEKRAATMQALGGTGGLKIGADFLKRYSPDPQVWISEPTWPNHRGIFEYAGFKVSTYTYYDPKTRGVDFAGMMASLGKMNANDIVVLHACCHNPTGADLTADQWEEVLAVVKAKRLIPFLDMAYQGFSEGIDADGVAVKRFSETVPTLFVSNSFSKSFSLYGERIGAFSIVSSSEDETTRAVSQLKRVIRTNYSNPPTYGAKLVGTVLADPALRKMWDDELETMRERIHLMRNRLVEELTKRKPGMDFSFITKQNGMFSYTGLTPDQVARLRKEHSLYMAGSGRICVAALNSKNITRVADAIASVL